MSTSQLATSSEKTLFYFRSRGVMITVHNAIFDPSMVHNILHEYVTGQIFGAGAPEECEDGGLHFHLVIYLIDKFTWVRQNVLEQLRVKNCHLQPIHDYPGAVNSLAYITKTNVPYIWAVTDEICENLKRHVRAYVIRYGQRQNTGIGLRKATAQLHRLEAVWFPSPPVNAKQLAGEVWGTQPDSSGYSIQDSEPQSQN